SRYNFFTICCNEVGCATRVPQAHSPFSLERTLPVLQPGARVARILLVEDDPNVLMLLEHVLRGADHDVDLAATVRQARSYLGKHRYDLVVADGKLPDGTGMAVGD